MAADAHLTQTRLFAVLTGDRYRSHSAHVFAYSHGAWQRTHTIIASTLELLLKCLREGHAYFLVMAHVGTQRDEAHVALELKTLQAHASPFMLADLRFRVISSKKAETKIKNWCYSCSDLCRTLYQRFASGTEHIERNYHRRCGSPLLGAQQQGVAFTDCYIETRNGVQRPCPKLRPDSRAFGMAAMFWGAHPLTCSLGNVLRRLGWRQGADGDDLARLWQ